MKPLEYLRQKAQALPLTPGVYIMKNSSNEVIYIGKAKILRNRVSQYFGSQNNHTAKVKSMVENVSDFDYIIVKSEFEALVLECSLIKQHKPKYNILLKDDKGYSYIKLSSGPWKSISSVFQKENDGSKYYGPYTSSDYVSTAVKEAIDLFKLPHCNKNFPSDIKPNGRPCLNYYINLCNGACCGKISLSENNKNINEALDFIFSSKNDIIKKYKEEMNNAADNLDFENAARYRDIIKSIERISEKQHVVALKHSNQDVFGIVSIEKKTSINVLRIREGMINQTDSFIIDRIDENEDDYVQILANYYSLYTDIPKRICIDFSFGECSVIYQFIENIANKKFEIICPKSGESHFLIEMAKKNATEKLTRYLSYNDKKKSVLYELQELLGLSTFPSVIEAYDISNTNGSENVAGMIVYENGKPSKKNYRKFMIKSFQGQDDFRSLAEVLNRRIGEYFIHEGEYEGFGRKPDLILLDGGKGQVSAVEKVLKERNFEVPLFGMVKDSKHKTRAITSGNKEIVINSTRSVFSFISEIQEEVHRYAIGYHRTLKKKNVLISQLNNIPGIGNKKAERLLLKFKSIDAIKNASIDDLLTVPGISKYNAEVIFNYFR